MDITASAISLNVHDVEASAAFAKDHFGFTEEMAADGSVPLARPDAGFNLLIYCAPDCRLSSRPLCVAIAPTVCS